MLALRRTRPFYQHSLPLRRSALNNGSHAGARSQRTLFTSTIQSLSNEFLDLAIALPFPASWPAYSSTIILVTIVSRLVLTVPFSIWAKKRQWRAEELVIPHLQELQPKVAQAVYNEMKKAGIRGPKEKLQAYHSHKVKQLLSTRRKQLYSEHHCSPITTMAIPVATQLPLFAATSLVLSNISHAPTPLDSESFLTLTSLAHADPTATLPIALGLITLANVDASRWFISEEKREQQLKVEKQDEAKRARGELVLKPMKMVQSGLRILAVGRILVGALVPGGVVIYWVTSAAFGLIQSWVFDFWEYRRDKSRRALKSQSESASPTSPSVK
ncbi:hypothetical protein JAAARDRAFT_117940 [Jaapia argillacea MUCL 33604]|uniref:Membrane insertase YidC/Oxa/ALB C-terminal domain-containing protein n=1 Tax=Jaapia argillacea MUCL 33604 TaxID=933084 RepID=A0A067QEG9_9AGAM|nr:hypothetical protein JAAARDRAFT_117940 [Jaapia argillacea MUCL 33604]